jgi:glyoxylase-like metal-dependent hydrolase (beta-lactamase superfamily II)
MFTEIPDVNRRTFKAGDQIEIGEQNYRVISAPGHSNRQVCFYQAEDERLLSADMLLPKTPVPLVETRLDGSNQRELGLKMMLESFNTFEQLKVRQVYPGHGSPFSDHTTLIQTQVARIHRRKSECLSLIRSGVDTLPELLKKMYRKMPVQARLSGLAMLIGYLDLLLADQKITKIEINGQHKYRPSRIP